MCLDWVCIVKGSVGFRSVDAEEELWRRFCRQGQICHATHTHIKLSSLPDTLSHLPDFSQLKHTHPNVTAANFFVKEILFERLNGSKQMLFWLFTNMQSFLSRWNTELTLNASLTSSVSFLFSFFFARPCLFVCSQTWWMGWVWRVRMRRAGVILRWRRLMLMMSLILTLRRNCRLHV